MTANITAHTPDNLHATVESVALQLLQLSLECGDATEAQKYTQSAVNAANALCALRSARGL